jgi:hypothetical protein
MNDDNVQLMEVGALLSQRGEILWNANLRRRIPP